MGIQVVWDDDEQTIVRFIYSETWDWQTFRNAIVDGNVLMDDVTHPVVSIVDMSATSYVPPGSISHIKWAVEYSGNHNNSRKVIFVRANTLYQVIVEAVKQSYPNVDLAASFTYVDDLESAREVAKKTWHELTDSQPEQDT